jgi:hypothetical protein
MDFFLTVVQIAGGLWLYIILALLRLEDNCDWMTLLLPKMQPQSGTNTLAPPSHSSAFPTPSILDFSPEPKNKGHQFSLTENLEQASCIALDALNRRASFVMGISLVD